jgi:N-acetylgalactosamine kinase
MVVCDSGIKACKSANARDQFNHRISCYRAGFALIRKLCPQYSGVLKHLRDVNVRTLQVPLTQIYRILLMLPEYATREQLAAMLPDTDLDTLFASHCPPADGLYPIRGVVMFGLAECERASAYADALKNGDISLIGELMKISHDGDRVVSFSDTWEPSRFTAPVDDAAIQGLLSDLESGDPERVFRAQLIRQPGSYACSIPEIDRMVDIANRTPGVAGAQLAGAGLGGCMMVLVKRDAEEIVLSQGEVIFHLPSTASL